MNRKEWLAEVATSLTPKQREYMAQVLAHAVHDLEKPRGAVKMFLDIAPDILANPEDWRKWRDSVMASFEKASEGLNEMRLQMQPETPSAEVV